MRTSTFNYIKDILADYPKTDEYIKQREEELRNPYFVSDLNAGIKGNKASYDAASNLLITIEQDRRLSSLERNRRIVSMALDVANEDTLTIIEELYFKKRPQYTMQGLVDNRLIFCSLRTAYNLRNEFFKDIANELNLEL